MDQPAATLWYHRHLHGATAEHVYRGLAGMFLLDDPEVEVLDLPTARIYNFDFADDQQFALVINDKETDMGRIAVAATVGDVVRPGEQPGRRPATAHPS